MRPLKISKVEARRFMTSYHHLSPARKLEGKQGILKYIRRVNCIQYDPINLVGQNPHLLLQGRIKNYSNNMPEEILYSDRKLLDVFDKVMSIDPIEDWPNFKQHREFYKNKNISPRIFSHRKSFGKM